MIKLYEEKVNEIQKRMDFEADPVNNVTYRAKNNPLLSYRDFGYLLTLIENEVYKTPQ